MPLVILRLAMSPSMADLIMMSSWGRGRRSCVEVSVSFGVGVVVVSCGARTDISTIGRVPV